MKKAIASLAVAAIACGPFALLPAHAQPADQIVLPSHQIPSGTALDVKLLQNISSATANVGDPVRVETVGNTDGLPGGTILTGEVTHVRPATAKYPGRLAIVFGTSSDQNPGIGDIASVHLLGTVAKSEKSKDIGIGAGIGGLLGLTRKRKLGDAVEGAAVGALGGYAVDQAQKHPAGDLTLQRGAPLTLQLDRTLVVRTTIDAE